MIIASQQIFWWNHYQIYKFFNDLDVESKILFLFNNINAFICKSLAAFIFETTNCRHDHVISIFWLNQLIIIIYFVLRE